MARLNQSDDPEVKNYLDVLKDCPERDPQSAAAGRDRFLAQARELDPGVSVPVERRHIGWYQKFLQRIGNNMKSRIVSTVLTAVALVGVFAVVMTRNVTSVSAQQIIERAAAVQSAQSTREGILHYRFEIFSNPKAEENTGTRTISESFEDTKLGYYRSVDTDPEGNILSAWGSDAAYTYDAQPAASGDGLVAIRTALPDEKKVQRVNVEVDATSLFEQFKNNPRVKLEGKQTWTDGSQVYVLVNDNYRTEKQSDGQEQSEYTGKMKMVFNVDTLQLVASELSLRKGDQDVVISSVTYQVDEVLPEGTSVAWDLSDLKGITYLDEPAQSETRPDFDTLTVQELTARTKTYLIDPLPEGYSLKIVAVSNQPKDQPYAYETNYTTDDGKEFDLQAIGATDLDFIHNNFYDSSYEAPNGLTLYFSTASDADSTSAILTTPEGNSFLLYSTLNREDVEKMIEKLTPMP